MPFQNRVTPLGELVAIPERGLVYGNRGRLHDARGAIRRPWQLKRWISCRLEFRGRYRPGGPMAPGRYTGLFFLDDATALAAGHRPCAECRRADYNAFRTAWAHGLGVDLPSAKQMDQQLHAERLFRGSHRRRLHDRSWASIPTGAFVLFEDAPALVHRDAILPWTTSGYTAAQPRPRHGDARLITPPAILAAFEAGYPVQIHGREG
jgi:hypothetical protein